MNYLFYLGIIIPTLITIVLFLIFIYCWFLQKARKEVLTKRYDPHGKMRRLGIPMEAPSPPAYCRIGGSNFFADIGEDNEAYDVSRSPSTEQNLRGGRPMYRTYHDSGISAGLGLSPTTEGEPRPGALAYRTCPDSGISGFGVQTMQTSACVHHHVCRGCCPEGGAAGGESIQMQQVLPQLQQLQQQQQQQHPLSLPSPQHQEQQIILTNQQFQTIQQQQQHQLQQRSYPQQEKILQQQQQQLTHVILHHNTVPASAHPRHGVCYGDDTTHLQSPHHYNPPPFQHQHAYHGQEASETDASVVGTRLPHSSSSNVNILPHIQEHPSQPQQIQPASAVLQRTAMCCSQPSPEHFVNTQTHQQHQPSSPLSSSSSSSCCHCHNQPYPHYHHQQQTNSDTNQLASPNASSLVLYSPQGDALPTNAVTFPTNIQAHYVNREGGLPALDNSVFKPKTFAPQSKDVISSSSPSSSANAEYPPPYQPNTATPMSPSSPSSSHPSSSQHHPMHSYRDSGVGEMVHQQAVPNTSPSDRPNSQASSSSTTDSEDSGFRSSHRTGVKHNNKLNKHENPLLKPLRRPRNYNSAKTGNVNNVHGQSKSGNGQFPNKKAAVNGKDTTIPGTPLTTLNPKTLSSNQNEEHHHNNNANDVILSTSMLETGGGGAGDNNLTKTRGPPRFLNLNGGQNGSSPVHSNGKLVLSQQQQQHSPIRENDWSVISSTNDNDPKSPKLQQQQQQHFDMTDISTHLSWKYLQDVSAASSKSMSSDGSNSSTDDSHRVISPLLRHAPPDASMDMFSYSVV